MKQKIEEYWMHNPSRFKYLEAVELRRVVDDASAEPYQLLIMLLEEPGVMSQRARLKFVGVRGIKFGSLDGLLGLLFEITDEAEMQMEDIKYRVVETEHHAFTFWCRDFEFKILPPPSAS